MSSRCFKDTTAVIVGGAAGIGRAVADGLAQDGATIAILDIDARGARETAAVIEESGGVASAISVDVADPASVADAFAQAWSSLGRFDIAVNCAGVAHAPALTADIPLDAWTRAFDVNVTGAWLCMREELARMAARGHGTIVNIASFTSLRTLPTQSAYVASKHALLGLTKNAAVEYAAMGIRINAVAPGGTRTQMLEGNFAGLDEGQRAAGLAQVAAMHPMNRTGSAEEVAAAVLFLCSSAASFMTGACLSVDGGWAAT